MSRMQIGPGDPPPAFRVRWKAWSGMTDWANVVDAPRVEEGVLVLKTSRTHVVWVPVCTITGPIEIEAVG